MPKRGDRVARPTRLGQWELRHAETEAADGWEKLCANIPSAAIACWDALASSPLDYSQRQKRLRAQFATRQIGGRVLPQWQFEITGGGRVWYCPDEERHLGWLTDVSIGHPSRTDTHKSAG
jgi:hypothetical protein